MTTMTIAVEFQVREDSVSCSEWLETWGARAEDAALYEPKTTSYEAAIAIDDPNRVLVFERYEEGEDTLRDHMAREAHQELMEQMQSRRMTKRRPWITMGFESTDLPWRIGSIASGGFSSSGAVVAILVIRPADSENLTRTLVERLPQPDSNPDILLVGASVVTVEDNNDYEMTRGDCVISFAFESLSAFEAYTDSPEWDELLEDLKTTGNGIILFRKFLTTGKGFLWKGGAI